MSESLKNLKILDRGPIREIQLDRPEVHNAFDRALTASLTAAFRDVADAVGAGRDIRGVLLTGGGRSFCSGADLGYMSAIARFGEDENRGDAEALSRMFLEIRRCPVFVVARVQGAALGGGTGLVACSDLVVASETARFGFTEVKLGIVPAVISPFVIDRIGPARARAVFPTGERFGAAEAQRIGLVDRVVPEADLDAAIEAVLGELLSAGPRASREAKQLIATVSRALPLQLDENAPVFSATAEWIARLRAGAEGQEGMSAFLEKRPPQWRLDQDPAS